MPWNLTYLTDGQQPLAAGINSLFTTASSAIDALDTTNIRRGAFNRFNGGPVVVGMDSPSGYQITGHHGQHEYSLATFGAFLQYDNATDFGINGGTASTGAVGSTWVSIGHPSATGPYVGAGGPEFLKVFDNPFRLDGSIVEGDSASFGVRAVEIGLNIEVTGIEQAEPSATATCVMFCIQFRSVESATWITIDRTIRAFSVEDRIRASSDTLVSSCDFDASIRTLLTVNDLTSSLDQVHSIRAMCALERTGGLVAGDTLRLREGNLTCVPIRCEYNVQ
jgi:hypothetical protein